jgi:hypothetical protein
VIHRSNQGVCSFSVEERREIAEPAKAYSENAKVKWPSAADTISADIRIAAAQIIADSHTPGSDLGTKKAGPIKRCKLSHSPWYKNSGWSIGAVQASQYSIRPLFPLAVR